MNIIYVRLRYSPNYSLAEDGESLDRNVRGRERERSRLRGSLCFLVSANNVVSLCWFYSAGKAECCCREFPFVFENMFSALSFMGSEARINSLSRGDFCFLGVTQMKIACMTWQAKNAMLYPPRN